MPISFLFDTGRNLVTIIAEGLITDDELRCYRIDLTSDPRFRPGMRILSDHRSVEKHRLSIEGAYQAMKENQQLESKLKDCRQAIVTSSDLHYGMTRMYIAMMSETFPNIRVFREMEEAQAWLFDETE